MYNSTNRVCNPMSSLSELNIPTEGESMDADKKTLPDCSMATVPYNADEDDDDDDGHIYHPIEHADSEDKKMDSRSGCQFKSITQPFVSAREEPEESVRQSNSVHEATPVRESTPVREISPIRDATPVRELTPMRDTTPVREITPEQQLSPMRDITPEPPTTARALASTEFSLLGSISPDLPPVDGVDATTDMPDFMNLIEDFVVSKPKPPPRKAPAAAAEQPSADITTSETQPSPAIAQSAPAHTSSAANRPTTLQQARAERLSSTQESATQIGKRKRIVTREEETMEEVKEEESSQIPPPTPSPPQTQQRQEPSPQPLPSAPPFDPSDLYLEEKCGEYNTVIYAPLVKQPEPPAVTRVYTGVNYKTFKKVKIIACLGIDHIFTLINIRCDNSNRKTKWRLCTW